MIPLYLITNTLELQAKRSKKTTQLEILKSAWSFQLQLWSKWQDRVTKNPNSKLTKKRCDKYWDNLTFLNDELIKLEDKNRTAIGSTFTQGNTQYTIIDSVFTGENTHYLLVRNNVQNPCFVIAIDFDHNDNTWGHGHYYNNLDDAQCEFLTYKAIYNN